MLISMRGIITDPITFISHYLHTRTTALHEIITKAYYYGISNTKSYLIHEYYVAANYRHIHGVKFVIQSRLFGVTKSLWKI